MIFTEPRFLVFFAVVFAVHWSLRGERSRKLWLLACSYAFYAAWDWRFLSLIGFSTLVDYFVGLRMAALGAGAATIRRRWLWVSLASNLGLLGVFKYLGFFVDTAGPFFEWLGFSVSSSTLGIILPVGISFYTFQTLSYSIDVYRGRLEASRDLPDFALFVAFFPQLVAGPIVRASHFLPQIATARSLARVNGRALLLLFLVGFFKKACVSDNLSPIVDAYFANPSHYDVLSAWVAIVSYAVQIYCDFSGYSDMAIACAGALGYQLGQNFDAPYLSSNIQDFWRRWHISLSSWLRDYLYIPLGGSRHGEWALHRNLLLTMTLGGLWHGAAWGFVLWGVLHGGALIVHRFWSERAPATRRSRVPVWLAVVTTSLWVTLTWVPFRAESLPSALAILKSALLGRGSGAEALEPLALVALIPVVVVHIGLRHPRTQELAAQTPGWLFAMAVGAFLALITTFQAREVAPFIYFQF